MSGVNTAGTKGVPRAASEAQLLDIAAEDIGRLGYAGLSVGEVAAGAGVSKPLVYGYFGSKDGLYVACVQRAASVLVQAIEEAISGPANLQMAERTLEAIFSALQPRPHDWNVLFDRLPSAVRAGRRRSLAGARTDHRPGRSGGRRGGRRWRHHRPRRPVRAHRSLGRCGHLPRQLVAAPPRRKRCGYDLADPTPNERAARDLGHRPLTS